MNFSSFACFNGPLSWNTLYNACCVKTVPDKKKMLLKHFEKEEYIGTSIFSFSYNVSKPFPIQTSVLESHLYRHLQN